MQSSFMPHSGLVEYLCVLKHTLETTRSIFLLPNSRQRDPKQPNDDQERQDNGLQDLSKTKSAEVAR